MKLTQKISFRVPAIICMVLLLGIGGIVFFYLNSQNSTIIDTKEKEIKQEADIIYTAIKNNMLAGEAPIAVELFRDFAQGNFASKIQLYRRTGTTAFSDNKTLREVNSNLRSRVFKPKRTFASKAKISSPDFNKSVKDITDVFVRDIQPDSKKLVVYKPLINQPRCSSCHGLDHVVRGIIMIDTPVDEVYATASKNIFISIILYAIVVSILTGIIIVFLHNVVIKRIVRIGKLVLGVGKGDFKTKVDPGADDELGELGTEINSMIDGLYERFKLSKFVSKSTLDHVQSDDDISLGGEKKNLTVLFSDVRQFTRFSENRDPKEVMEVLNKLMNMQTDIVHKFGGDVDKYVGDELMAIFDGKDMEYRALQAAQEMKDAVKQHFVKKNLPIAVGIGVNTGEMISGNMGSQDQIDRTVLGDAVNIGSRLCSAAGKHTIVFSEFTYEAVKGRIDAVEHKPIKVKGKERTVKIYTLRNTL